ncbi:MAG TPA: beta-ketoacyl synthase N-terminal-like domain-containing protein, partial [Acetobacteraceae bacterium]|nr:beta-ketoacyl synthase N-terminal-like domain-containing protein [Acetobacteraceae bacterium]
DSILAVELARRIQDAFGVELRATRLYDQPTPRRLATLIATADREARAATGRDAPPVAPAPAPAPTAAALVDDSPTEPALGVLREALAEVLSLDATDVAPEIAPIEFGLDHHGAVEVASRVAARLGLALDAATVMRADSVTRLAEDLARGVGAAASTPLAPAAVDPDAVAVIGMAGRFPGAPDLDTFWRNLRDGVDSITEVPPDRFSLQGIYDPQPGKPGRSYCKHGGFLEGVDRFDPRFFGITSAEAEVMDPQQRLFLETAWHALEDAGLPDRALDGAACAVFVGCSHGDYAQMAGTARLSAQFGMGNVGSILAARIAYHLNLRGPAVAVDTACSSSLVAVHLACQALRTGECDLAVAGGVALMTTPGMHVLTSHARMLSPGGRCRTFDAAADGFVPAEGVGAVVLKPLARAMADGDRIHGVIEGTGTNQDGRSAGLTRPSLAAQRELQLAVWARFRVDPATIGCIEAHGTGTALGDPIEMQALIDAFRSRAPAMRQGRCAIGSVKSNIGHAVPAAGIAGLIKALLMLRHATVAPSLHFHEPNPHVDLATSPFHVPQVAAPWPAPPGDGPRRVAINAFGFSGTNAHAVVADAPTPPPAPAREAPWLFALSARTPDALRRRAADLSAWLGRTPDAPLADVAHTLAAGRGHMRHRAAVIAADRGELVAALDALAQDGSPSSSASPQGGKAATRSALAGLARAEKAEGRGTALADLAEAYRAGAGLGPLENRASGRFLSLPGYPFERRRCWVEAGPAVASPPPRALDEHHVPADSALLVQHVVRGRPVLPAAAGLAMLLGACGPHRALVDLRWLRPALPDADGLRLHLLRDEPSPDDGTGVALAFAGGGRHMAARLVEDGHLVPGASMELAAILARCSDPVPVEPLYARLAALDIAHGPAFRCIAGLRRSPARDELLADLVPGGGADAVPFLIDAALHSIAALSDAAPDGEPPLPASLERAVAHGQVADARHAWVRLRAADPAVDGSSDGCFDLVISDEAGRVLLRLDGFRSRPSGTTRASQRA